MPNSRHRGPNGHPQTLQEFVRLGYSMRWSCHRCAVADVHKADMEAAVARHGPDYSTSQFMRDMHCSRCGDKIGILTESPEERAQNARIFGASSAVAWDSLEPTLP